MLPPKHLFELLHLLELDGMFRTSESRVLTAQKRVEDAKLGVGSATRSLHRAEGHHENPLNSKLKEEIETLTEESERQRLLDWLKQSQQQESAEDLDKPAKDVVKAKVWCYQHKCMLSLLFSVIGSPC